MPATEAVAAPDDVWGQIESQISEAKQQEIDEAIAQEEQAKLAAAKAAEQKIPEGENKVAPWIAKCHTDYLSGISHVFVLHGNITDYPDQSSLQMSMDMYLSAVFDDKWKESRLKAMGQQVPAPKAFEWPRVFAYYTVNNGLVYADKDSKAVIDQAVTEHWKVRMKLPDETIAAILNPTRNTEETMVALNYIFEALKANMLYNRQKKGTKLATEAKLTVAFLNGNYLFPNGPILHMQQDRSPVAFLYNWAQDASLADRVRVIVLTPNLDDIHETIRGGDSGVSCICIKRPDLEAREKWLKSFETYIGNLPDKGFPAKPFVGGKRRSSIVFDTDVNHHIMAIQAAGLNLKQQEQIIRASWCNNMPLSLDMIREHKKRIIEEQYGGLIDIVEPEFGFEVVGGHEHLAGNIIKIGDVQKRDQSTGYFWRNIINPLRRGDKRACSKGVLLTGPPGTGKTMIALALAKESRMNFMVAHLDRLFGGIVGETENKTRQFIAAVESAAPVIVFMDELESVLSSGRQSPGDSGTSSRVFNSLMQFLSDDSRAGKIVVVAATNRPDMLDVALIREGRIDSKIPVLPPVPGDRKGRTQILRALCRKHKVKFDTSLADVKAADRGINRLLNHERVWTGAEIEVVLKDAIDNSLYRTEVTVVEDIRSKYHLKPADEIIGDAREEWAKRLNDTTHSPVISQADWEDAMDSVQPNTRDIDLQIDLSLMFANKLKYVPKDWLDRAKDKDKLQSSIAQMSEGGYSREL